MEEIKFEINDIIGKDIPFTEMRADLFKKGVYSKDYEDEDLVLLYSPFNNPQHNNLTSECRSMVINKATKKIISYSCDRPICNQEAINILMERINDKTTVIHECFEGSLLHLFNHNNKWYLTTRRCLNAEESIWKNGISHFHLFMEVIEQLGITSFSDFTSKLNTSNNYYFILLHHVNQNIVDYTNKFGEKYKKLCLAFIRNKETQNEVNIHENFPVEILGEHIITSPNYPDLKILDDYNKQNNWELPPKMEGLLIKVKDDSGKLKIIKLQTNSYQFASAFALKQNIYLGFIKLYQMGTLKEYLEINKNLDTYNKIVNPLNNKETYDIVGVVDSVFKVLTSELYGLYKLLWNLKTSHHYNSGLYTLLPREYKNILFCLRGIYFSKKNKDEIFSMKDIYEYLKIMQIDEFENLLRVRKLMFNWTKVDKSNIELATFKNISINCDKVHYKLMAMFTNLIFPEIMPTDIPNK